MRVSDNAPERESMHIISAKWTGRVNKSTLKEYMLWMNQVNSQLAQEWNVRFMHVFKKSETSSDIYGYDPDGTIELIKKIRS